MEVTFAVYAMLFMATVLFSLVLLLEFSKRTSKGRGGEASANTKSSSKKRKGKGGNNKQFKEYMASGAEDFVALVEDPHGAGWSEVLKNDFIRMSKKDGTENCFVGTFTIEASPATVATVLTANPSRQTEFDKVVESVSCVIENPTYRLIHVKTKAPWPVTPRDLCLLAFVKKLDDGSILLLQRSVEHSSVPEQGGFVRAVASIQGYLLKPGKAPGTTDVVNIYDVDPTGSLPTSVVEMVTLKGLPKSMQKLAKLVKGEPVAEKFTLGDVDPNAPEVEDDDDDEEMSAEEELLVEVQALKKKIESLEKSVAGDSKLEKAVHKAAPYLVVATAAMALAAMLRR